MNDFFKTFSKEAIGIIYSSVYNYMKENKNQQQPDNETCPEAAEIVKNEWLNLIECEGMEAAKTFMQLCREKQYSPSSHLDYVQFLEAGKMAMLAHHRKSISINSPLNS